MKRISILALVTVTWATSQAVAPTSRANHSGAVPEFQVDAFWPKPLPNKWVLGMVNGLFVDHRDHVWVLQRPASLVEAETGASTNPPIAECCIAAPPVIEFDAQGNVVQAWGGPGAGYEWPVQEHGIVLDYKGNVWITGSGDKDGQILKFTRDGKFLLQIGHQNRGRKGANHDTSTLWRPAEVAVDPTTNEAFVADGEHGNHRVIVFDADTGAYKRHWGAYGNPPDEGPPSKYVLDGPPAKTFSDVVHCVRVSKDGLVYVCDRGNNRVQVFHRDGTFVKEGIVGKGTLGNGSVTDLEFSPDQDLIYVADGTNQKIWIVQRSSLEVLGSFGQLGHSAGQFRTLHGVAVDSKGNVFAAEVSGGNRVQRFVRKSVVAGLTGH
jgi:hypothetical protein